MQPQDFTTGPRGVRSAALAAEGIAKANQIINQSLTREYLQHESNLALQKFAEKGGTSTGVIPANMQTAPRISIGAK